MAVTRTWSWIAPVAAGALLLAACTDSEPEPAPPAVSQQAPAAQQPPAAAGQPAAPQAAAPAPAAPAGVVEELYVDSEPQPDEGEPPLTVKFVTTVENDHELKESEVECEWDFGDGSPKAKGMSPTHVYKTEGDFVAQVVCKDAKGVTGETDADVMVFKYE
jgi:PKD repeat protein